MTASQARLAEAEEDKAKLTQRNEQLAARLKESEQAASIARAEAHRNMDQLTQLDQDLRETEASLTHSQEQLQQALQVGAQGPSMCHAEIYEHTLAPLVNDSRSALRGHGKRCRWARDLRPFWLVYDLLKTEQDARSS